MIRSPFTRPVCAPFRILPLVLFALLPPLAAVHGQTAGSGKDLRGVWQIGTPEEGPLILIVKKNNRASWFWGENADRTVYQGTWVEDEDGIELTWANGSRHILSPVDTGFQAAALDAGGGERYRVTALRVPEEVLGQWARPPRSEEDLLTDRDRAEGFFGLWEVGEGDAVEHVFVEPDRSTAGTWTGSAAGERGLRGSWARQGSELHIVWDTGHYSILREIPRGYDYVRLQPGAVIEENEESPVPAKRRREAEIAPEWRQRYDEERAAESGGIAFSSRRNAQRFYRGDWLVRRGENAFERIAVGRFGGLESNREKGLEGEWRLSGQDLFMRWDDGIRRILGPVGDGFVLYEYDAGRPLDGVPTRIFPATPADSGKLQEHLAGRAQVGEQLRTLAEAAGADAPQPEAGWGRTFMRWAWPFGGTDEAPETASELLEDEFEASGKDDPWWWPFWSEKAVPDGKAGEKTESAGSEGPDGSGQAEEPEEPEDTGRSDWLWPF